MKMIILIPPSEGKADGGSAKPMKPTKEQKEMISRLHSFKGDWGKLLGVKDKALAAAQEANAKILKAKTLPAIERYTGVVYNGIDYQTLSPSGKKNFDSRVRMVSALFGLVAPTDLIPNYKLKIEKLDAAKYWKPLIGKELSSFFVIDLLPQAHKKAVEYENGMAVEFVIEKKGKKIPAGHNGKLIKGRFVRWLCENNISDSKDFKKFKEDGFSWTGEYFLKKV